MEANFQEPRIYQVGKVVREENVPGCIRAGSLIERKSLVHVSPSGQDSYSVLFAFNSQEHAQRMGNWIEPGACETAHDEARATADALDRIIKEGRL